jgi:glycolate oxidase iron-sulfur subunit
MPEHATACTHAFDMTASFDACIHCGMCLSACPTYVETGDESQSPRGRIHLAEAWQQGRLTFEDIQPALDTCLGCMACETACPSKVPYHHVLEATRFEAESIGQGRFSLFARGLQWVLQQDVLLAFGTWGMKLAQGMGIRRLMQASFWPGFIRQRMALWPALPNASLSAGLRQAYAPDADVALHLGCVMKHIMPDVHMACEQVLQAMGVRVTPAPIGCCGALAAHHGLRPELTALLETNAKASACTLRTTQPVLSNAGGCGAMVQHSPHYAQLMGCALETAQALQQLADQTQDIHAWIWEHRDRLPPLSLPNPVTVTYQASCHMHHVQRVQQAPLALLSQIDGVRLVPMMGATDCCGSAGVYNLEFPETADAIAQRKARAILETGAQVVVVGNPGCLLQLKAAVERYAPQAGIEVLHPVQFMARCLIASS